jgi:trimeric autotransporter adhesin
MSVRSVVLLVLSIAFAGCGNGGGDHGPGGSGGDGGAGGDTFAQRAYVKASNTEAFDQFGTSVALSGETLAVGAQTEASGATGVNGDPTDNSLMSAGAGYVFTRDDDGVWTQQAYIKASNTGPDTFGSSIALSADTLVVGAPFEGSSATGVNGNQDDEVAPGSGAGYVFTRDGNGSWAQQAYLKASNTDTNDQFGFSVALDGDTLAVGAIIEGSADTGIDGDQGDNTAGGAGAVYVFARDAGSNWSQQAYVKASNTEAFDEFGTSVAVSGDTLAVGAPMEDSASTGVDGDQADNAAMSSGAVYVFTRDAGGLWIQQAYIKASNTDVEDMFGTSVALSGDTLAVGAPMEDSASTGVDGDQTDNTAMSSGAAYVFTRDAGGNWSQQVYLKASNTEQGDRFGHSVALDGEDLVVGAWLEDINATGINPDPSDNTGTASGAAYLFTRDGTAWSQRAYIKASNTDAGDNFGSSVAIEGGTVAVGATQEMSASTGVNGDEADDSVSAAGAVYVFR